MYSHLKSTTLVLVLIALLTLLPAPMPALAHQGGLPAHPHEDESQPATQVSQPAASPSSGGLHRWADDSGQVHYSQGLNSVPEQFRSRAVPLDQPTPSSPSATK